MSTKYPTARLKEDRYSFLVKRIQKLVMLTRRYCDPLNNTNCRISKNKNILVDSSEDLSWLFIQKYIYCVLIRTTLPFYAMP